MNKIIRATTREILLFNPLRQITLVSISRRQNRHLLYSKLNASHANDTMYTVNVN